MKTTRITEIAVETDEVFIIRRLERPFQAWCAECAAAVQMVAPEQAATMLGVGWRDIARRVEVGQLHFIEMPAGRLLVCVNSLA